MDVIFHGQKFIFRECDTRGIEQAKLQDMAEHIGRMQYDPNAAWLYVPTIGYGRRED